MITRLGSYLSPEPLLQEPGFVGAVAADGQAMPTFAYARNNPLMYVDPDGLHPGHPKPNNLPATPPDFCRLNPGSCPHTTPGGTNWDPGSFKPRHKVCEIVPSACKESKDCPNQQSAGPFLKCAAVAMTIYGLAIKQGMSPEKARVLAETAFWTCMENNPIPAGSP